MTTNLEMSCVCVYFGQKGIHLGIVMKGRPGKWLGFIVLGGLVHSGGRYVDFWVFANNRWSEETLQILEMEESEKIGWPIEINIIEEVMFRRGGVFALIYVGSSL